MSDHTIVIIQVLKILFVQGKCWKLILKKITDTKGTFHAKMGSNNGMGLTEAEDIKKRWQEYTKELYKKKIFMTKIITMV